MTYRTIPIRIAAPVAVTPPRLVGEPVRIQALLAALEHAVSAELQAPLPAGAWLRELRVDDREVVLTLAPGRFCADVAQVAFETLRLRLHDTDIFVDTAQA